MNCNGIGKRIAKLRNEKSETQAELAKALHVKRETVNMWENGTRDLKTLHTVALANHFGVTCDEILRGIKSENVDIHRKTGLDDMAIKKLKEFIDNSVEKTTKNVRTQLTNALICDPNYNKFIESIDRYTWCMVKPPIKHSDEYTQKLHVIMDTTPELEDIYRDPEKILDVRRYIVENHAKALIESVSTKWVDILIKNESLKDQEGKG